MLDHLGEGNTPGETEPQAWELLHGREIQFDLTEVAVVVGIIFSLCHM